MLKSHEKFHSANGKRLILIVDDERINRELLGAVLETDYELLYAEDGQSALMRIREQKDMLSLILLDLQMPVASGWDVLRELREDPALRTIPVIVLTGDQNAEVECLELGAADFIPKPYPQASVIQARVRRTIELSEDRDIIQSTERDPLTGLYNREFFYRYGSQYDQHHRGTEMDAIVVDVNHFHMINERFGITYGDEVLRHIGEKLREAVSDTGGIVCRRSADTFMIYCPHREDYKRILENAAKGLSGEKASGSRVRLRMGVYSNVDKSIEIQRRFDRAKSAADTVKGSFTRTIAFYDNTLHERELYAEQLIEDFHTAIAMGQFKVYYQPKFDVREDTPLLTSAEALVRWMHPKLGTVSPGVFIPLFEENGLIQELDTFVWKETARQISEWKERLGYYVPVSVNVSRIDLYDPNLIDTLSDIVAKNGLSPAELILEVTESAYTQDSDQIVEMVSELRDLGFRIEMDDFGTGYSSLNMISALPIDALKLDMHFIRDAFRQGGNTHMLEIIIEISDYLSVPVIAEGVETEKQLDALRALGCDIVQGYFFSSPVPPAEFEPFILQLKEAAKADARSERLRYFTRKRAQAETIFKDKAEQISSDLDPDAEEKKRDDKHGLRLRIVALVFGLIAALAAAVVFISGISLTRGYQRMENAADRYVAAEVAASDMESVSDYLTDRVRCFVVTGELEYLDDFLEEVNVNRRRDLAVEKLEELLSGRDDEALGRLNMALTLSNELVETEYRAMRLMLEAGDYDLNMMPEELSGIKLTEAERSLDADRLREQARTLVFDGNYMHFKDRIRENVTLCTRSLISTSSQELEEASAHMTRLIRIQTAATILLLLTVLAFVAFVNRQILRPLGRMVRKMQDQKQIEPSGAEELRVASRIYNEILEENRAAREKLSHEASHDALTGLFNRGAYELLMESVDVEHMALLVVDVDNFKQVNDTFGHAMGDRVLKRVAEILQNSFRSVDIICRVGGDEFVVIMTRVNSAMRHLVKDKIDRANELLCHPKDDLPPISLSVGVAFADRENPQGDIFSDADAAAYRVKRAGGNGCGFFE
ncbi:MAG: EAL domain-containing protein [Oscillospiraceae bacterium]|nr:EAL domain-containing protein [Oscillospiraceae bacterium]